MSKRAGPNELSNTTPRKKFKTVNQTHIDTYFQSPQKSQNPAQSKGLESSESGLHIRNRDKGDGPLQPYVIDSDEDEKGLSALQPGEPVLGFKGKERARTPTSNRAIVLDPSQFESLSVDPVVYHATDQPWPHADAPYAFLAHALSTVAQTRSRITILNTLTNCFRTILVKHPASLLPSLYLLSNSLAPSYVPVELGLGPSSISRAIQNISGTTPAALKRLYNALGDPGDVALSAKSNIRTLIPHPPLTIFHVYNSLLKIANSRGQGAAKQKEKVVESLLLSANGEEIRFLTRTLCQNLRVGAVRTSMLSALARAFVLINITKEESHNALTISYGLLTDVRRLSSNTKHKPTDTARAKLNYIFSEAGALLKRVFFKHPNYDDIISSLLESGLCNLEERVQLTIGIPIHPTLGSPMRSLTEVYEKLDNRSFIAEFKYDGQRAQIHAKLNQGKLEVFKIFSRHLEDMTTKYPDIYHLIQELGIKNRTITSFIMDAEIVAIDPRTGILKTFQELSNRQKKDVELKDIQVSVCLFAFDLMYLNEKPLLQYTFRERRSLLHKYFSPYTPTVIGPAHFAHVESMESEQGKPQIEEFWRRAVESKCEGLMIKLLDNVVVGNGEKDTENKRKKPLPATYEPDKRTAAWLKLKKDYISGIGDSLDLVPIGAWYGNGRKVKWWSPMLMGLYNSANGRFVAVCKCMSGFTDKFYQDLKDRYYLSDEVGAPCAIQPLWECDLGGFKPDVYFQPREVWEIRGADITISPVSVAAKGLVSASKGLSIRFPRFIKIREDKSIENANTPEHLVDIWKRQQQITTLDGNEPDDLQDIDLSDSPANSGDDILSEDDI